MSIFVHAAPVDGPTASAAQAPLRGRHAQRRNAPGHHAQAHGEPHAPGALRESATALRLAPSAVQGVVTGHLAGNEHETHTLAVQAWRK